MRTDLNTGQAPINEVHMLVISFFIAPGHWNKEVISIWDPLQRCFPCSQVGLHTAARKNSSRKHFIASKHYGASLSISCRAVPPGLSGKTRSILGVSLLGRGEGKEASESAKRRPLGERGRETIGLEMEDT